MALIQFQLTKVSLGKKFFSKSNLKTSSIFLEDRLANGNMEWLYQVSKNACGVEVKLVQVMDPYEINQVTKFVWRGCLCEYLVAFLNMLPGLRELKLPEDVYHYKGGMVQ